MRFSGDAIPPNPHIDASKVTIACARIERTNPNQDSSTGERGAHQPADAIIKAVVDRHYDVIVSNFTNPDMVVQAREFDAAPKATGAVERCFGRVLEAVGAAGGGILITSNQGGAEQMSGSESGRSLTGHARKAVPLIRIGRKAAVAAGDALEDIAPIKLYLLGLPVPAEMTGRSLIDQAAPAQETGDGVVGGET